MSSNLKEGISTLAGTYGKAAMQVMLCTVVSSDLSTRTCTVLPVTDNLSQFEAQLQCDIADGILIEPLDGSTVRVMLSEICTPFVVQFSDIKSMYMVGGTGSVKIYDTAVELNGDTYGGVPKVENTADRINRLEQKMNSFIAAFNTHTHATAAAGPPSPPTIIPPATTPTNITPLTVRADLENIKVKHGDGE